MTLEDLLCCQVRNSGKIKTANQHINYTAGTANEIRGITDRNSEKKKKKKKNSQSASPLVKCILQIQPITLEDLLCC